MKNERKPLLSVGDAELDSMILKLDKPRIASAVISEARRQGVARNILLETVRLWEQGKYQQASALLNEELMGLKSRQKLWEL